MTTLYVEGKTVYQIEEMGKRKLVQALSKIFPQRDFSKNCTSSLMHKLKAAVTSGRKEKAPVFDYVLQE
jgi:hypothetical protein